MLASSASFFSAELVIQIREALVTIQVRGVPFQLAPYLVDQRHRIGFLARHVKTKSGGIEGSVQGADRGQPDKLTQPGLIDFPGPHQTGTEEEDEAGNHLVHGRGSIYLRFAATAPRRRRSARRWTIWRGKAT